ncbi:MAG TPA: hypothetical protein VLU46_06045 [Thermoanaerobaculia bacterium]|nr:hypothetical protein [Thermoanaerobaculia bacterium]
MWKRPSWYTDEHDKGWSSVREAFARDWEQTKHDFGSDNARDLKQDAGDTVRQATTGTTDKAETFDKHEQPFRFGYSAQRQYRTQHPSWTNDLETRLREDYGSDFDRDRNDIRRAYEYRGTGTSGTARDESRERI